MDETIAGVIFIATAILSAIIGLGFGIKIGEKPHGIDMYHKCVAFNSNDYCYNKFLKNVENKNESIN